MNNYFDKIFCINLAHRTDRWEHVQDQCKKHGIELERVEGIYVKGWGNFGCTNSHRMVLDRIAAGPWNRVLVLEDDFECSYPNHNDLFNSLIQYVPDDWDMLYLGGHYGDKPLGRVNKHCIRAGYMKTTSSYGITREHAARMAPFVAGQGGIDDLMSYFNMGWSGPQKTPWNVYILQPRLMVQYGNYSDIQQKDCDNMGCMMDTYHENLV